MLPPQVHRGTRFDGRGARPPRALPTGASPVGFVLPCGEAKRDVSRSMVPMRVGSSDLEAHHEPVPPEAGWGERPREPFCEYAHSGKPIWGRTAGSSGASPHRAGRFAISVGICTSRVRPVQPHLRGGRWWSLVFLGALIVATTGGGLAASPLKIGLLAPPNEAEAQSLRRGVEVAVASIRSRGVAVEFVIRGRTGQWGVDGDEAAQLALDDGAEGLISPPSGASTHLVLQVAGRTATPVVSLCPDSSVTGAGIPWMLQVVPETRAEARALWAHLGAVGKEPLQSWVAVVPAGRAGREIAADLRWAATNSAVRILQVLETPASENVGDAALARAGASFMSKLADALAIRPAGLLIWLDPGSAGRLTKQIREAGYRGHLVGPGRLLSPIFRKAAGLHAMTVHVAVPGLEASRPQIGEKGP